jgi:hypothetical protein
VKLSDSDWHTVLEAVGPLPKGARLARARRKLAKCLRDYPGMRRSRAQLRAAQAYWQRKHELATELYAMYREEWRKGWTYNALIDDALKKHVLRSTAVWTKHFAAQVRARDRSGAGASGKGRSVPLRVREGRCRERWRAGRAAELATRQRHRRQLILDFPSGSCSSFPSSWSHVHRRSPATQRLSGESIQ